MLIRPATPADTPAWERLRQTLWPAPAGEHAREIAAWLAGERLLPGETFLACDDGGRAIGFAEASLRPVAEGCYSGRVTSLEGWYVEPAWRRRGVGSALVEAVAAWGRAEGSTEMASDVVLDDLVSHAAHRALGFAEVERAVHFRRDL
ncbi:MAG TPA: GNAT family N-acetyltransferase [Thermoanaerobaculia bacterium]|nr:GNAT family N-acetyltransferase [Thermoanaerobaculia bacterium]